MLDVRIRLVGKTYYVCAFDVRGEGLPGFPQRCDTEAQATAYAAGVVDGYNVARNVLGMAHSCYVFDRDPPEGPFRAHATQSRTGQAQAPRLGGARRALSGWNWKPNRKGNRT